MTAVYDHTARKMVADLRDRINKQDQALVALARLMESNSMIINRLEGEMAKLASSLQNILTAIEEAENGE